MFVLAFAVHVLTASGAAIALLALIAATSGDWTLVFGLLGLALIVDAIDGPLARALKVTESAPRWSGDVLDLVVDFTTYVFVPAYIVATAGLLHEDWAALAGAVIVVSGALYFGDRNMKSADNYFRGFPAVWNLVAFYLMVLRPGTVLCLATVLVFAVLTFVPVRFVHPLRVRRLRPVTLVALLVWALLATTAIWEDLRPEFGIQMALCAIAAYFLMIGFLPPHRPKST
jgi:phosphatidylcholine synthase